MTEPKTRPCRKALRTRERVKGKKPKFVRPESWRYVRLKKNWRNPRGLDHKVRLMYKGWPPAAGAGYGGPRVSRGLHPSGYREVLVHNVEQLDRVDPKTQAIRIAHTVGKKNRGDLLADARRKKIVVLNLGQAGKALAKRPEEEKEKEEAAETEKETNEQQEAPEEEKSKVEEKTKKRKGRSTE